MFGSHAYGHERRNSCQVSNGGQVKICTLGLQAPQGFTLNVTYQKYIDFTVVTTSPTSVLTSSSSDLLKRDSSRDVLR